jgi:hypothetical protein
MQHIMNVLTDLYSDRELACIREYATNALDSHRMAGTTRPVEISLPTPLRQTYEVRDFGLGLSPSELEETYGTYGASTKRDTNDATGCLGLGSKSALTYTNMFTVRAVKNGVLTECAIYRDDNMAGSLEIVDTKDAHDEPNGVTIIIPTSGNSSFEDKALKFFSTWDSSDVIIHGKEIDHVKDKGIHLNDKVWIVPAADRYYSVGKFIVMGGVTYPIGGADQYGYRNDTYGQLYDTYYFADMGEIDFVPSREALNMTSRTEEVVDEVKGLSGTTLVETWTQKQINDASDLMEAVKVWRKYKTLTNRTQIYTYGDTQLRDSISMGETRMFDPTTNDPKRMNDKVYGLNLASKDNYLFVLNRPEGKVLSRRIKAQIRAYIKKKKLNTTEVLFGKVPDNELYKDIARVRWSTIEKIEVELPKLERQPRTDGGVGKFKQMNGGSYSYYKTELPKGKQLVGVNGHFTHLVKNASVADPDTCFVLLGLNRIDKFYRDNPKAITFDAYRENAKKNVPSMTETEWKWLGLGYGSQRIIQLLNNSQLDEIGDDLLKEFKQIDSDAVEKKKQAWYNVGKEVPYRKDYIGENYPLTSYLNISHTVIYMAAIAAKKAV